MRPSRSTRLRTCLAGLVVPCPTDSSMRLGQHLSDRRAARSHPSRRTRKALTMEVFTSPAAVVTIVAAAVLAFRTRLRRVVDLAQRCDPW